MITQVRRLCVLITLGATVGCGSFEGGPPIAVAKSVILEQLRQRPCDHITIYQVNRSTFIRNPPTPLDAENEVVRHLPDALGEGFVMGDTHETNGVIQIPVVPKGPSDRLDAIVIENDDNSWIRYTPKVVGCRSIVDTIDILDVTVDPNNPKRADVAYRANLKTPTTIAAAYAKISTLQGAIAPEAPEPLEETMSFQKLDATGWQMAL